MVHKCIRCAHALTHLQMWGSPSTHDRYHPCAGAREWICALGTLDLPDVLPNGEKVRPCHTTLPGQAPALAPSKQEFLETHSQKRAAHRLPMLRGKLASCEMSKSALPALLAAPQTGDHVAMGIVTPKRKGWMEDIGNPAAARDIWEGRVRSRPK